MNVISLFSGIGGLDLGFINAGFKVIWSNDSDKYCQMTYCNNLTTEFFDNRNFEHIHFNQIPNNCEGIISGLPGNGWSISGSLKGINDRQGQYIFDIIRLIKAKKPHFFCFEVLAGFSLKNNRQPYLLIINLLEELNYNLSVKILNAKDFLIAQDRKRLYIIGIKKEMTIPFSFPKPNNTKVTMKDIIFDIKDNAFKANNNDEPNGINCVIPNHEYSESDFSPLFWTRNRVREWNDISFTIQGDRRNIPIHPMAPKMIKERIDKFSFAPNAHHLYRRLSIRECARLQSFDDDFILYYNSINNGYSLIGNATPPLLSNYIAKQIYQTLSFVK